MFAYPLSKSTAETKPLLQKREGGGHHLDNPTCSCATLLTRIGPIGVDRENDEYSIDGLMKPFERFSFFRKSRIQLLADYDISNEIGINVLDNRTYGRKLGIAQKEIFPCIDDSLHIPESFFPILLGIKPRMVGGIVFILF